MDENFRKQRFEMLFLKIGISYGKSAGLFFEGLGVNVVEELNFLEEEYWDNICNIIVVPIMTIQRRKSEKARQALMVTGKVDLSIGAPLPIQQNISFIEENNQPTVGRNKRKKYLSHKTVGNLTFVTTHFTRLTGTDAKESTIPSYIIHLIEDSNQSVNISDLIESQNWRS